MARSPEHWSQLSSLIDALLDAVPDQRDALIAELSGGDPDRRSELERLMDDFQRDAPLLDRPAPERFAALLDEYAERFPEELASRYALTREIGRGGMATVYLARDLKHARDVAVKVIHPALASALGGERFLREIEIVAQLRHPHIVPLFDSGTAGGSLYYVMPYEPGASLRQRLALQGPLPFDEVVFILRDVCDALAYAHQHGIVHRDIKPDNILLSGRHALVADFGVSKALGVRHDLPAQPETVSHGATTVVDGGVITTVMMGTPMYMAPEQIAGDAGIDHRADIYSLGVLAYELVAGRPPFAGDGREGVLAAHLSQPPKPLATHRPDVPVPLAELVMRCLAKRPQDRWPDADALVSELEALASRSASWRSRWEDRHVEPLTDFSGSEVDAAISADGRLVAFLADRDGVFDAYVTEVRSGTFLNLTNGGYPELFNEDVRNVGFSGDATHVWVRVADIGSPASVSIVPATGGTFRPFLATAVTAAWSPDGSKVAYHETTPGDPIHVADHDGTNARRIFVADAGVHNHHLSWSPDGHFLYFSHGSPPNEMDVWRIPADGGPAERITAHNSRVAYPVPVDERLLLYTATADDGTGPWLYAMDLKDRVPQRATRTVEHYISIAASAEVPGQPRRLVATVSNPTVQLWTVPITDRIAMERDASRRVTPTSRSAAPRFGPNGVLVYLASRGGAYGLCRQVAGEDVIDVWKAGEGAVDGAAAVSPDGSTVCVPVRRGGRSMLYLISIDGTAARPLAESLDVTGAASWSADGKWVAVAAKGGTGAHVFKVPIDGGPPVQIVASVSSNPVWSPNGAFILYSGAGRARSVPVEAVTPDGERYPFPALSVDRVGDSYRFLPGGIELVVKLGGFRHQDFWLFDLATGQRRQLTSLRPGASLHRFDVSPDGRQILFERVQENSSIVLIELPRR